LSSRELSRLPLCKLDPRLVSKFRLLGLDIRRFVSLR
jgi:hypothetical protein